MSAQPIRKRPPSFITSEYVDVEVDAEELERAGWVFVGKGEGAPSTETVLDVVRRWHDDAHPGPWQWCPEEPCDTLRGRDPSDA